VLRTGIIECRSTFHAERKGSTDDLEQTKNNNDAR
jgi:hypothetical protein